MDKTLTYRKMCEKSLQYIKWEPQIGDYVYRKYTVFSEEQDREIWPDPKSSEEIDIIHYKSDAPFFFHAVTDDGKSRILNFKDSDSLVKATSVPLFRQDQLQEMIFEGLVFGESIPCAMLKLLYEYGHKAKNPDAEYWHICKSMEQLWLTFVMFEKYNKTWDGENWA